MELEEIMLVIRNCCTESQLRSLLPGQNLGRDPYRRAAELLLEGDESADAISAQLDRSSAAQREKIRQLSLADLRKSLVVEFLEPGRNLGLVVWALLRDGRVGAAHLASQIYRTFAGGGLDESPKPLRTSPAEEPASRESGAGSEWKIPEYLVSEEESAGIGEDIPESFAEMEEEFGSDEEGIDDLDEILGAVVKEIKAEATADGEEEEMDFDFESDLEEEESIPSIDQEALTGILSETDENLVPPDIDDLEEILSESVEPLEEVALEDSFLGGGLDEETIEVPDADEIGSILDETLDLETDEGLEIPDIEELTGILEEELSADEEGIFEPGAELPPVFKEKKKTIDSSDVEPLKVEEQEPVPVVRHSITMAGIDVPIESLHRACCGVFGEPVELVTDPELLAQDKIGVVGRHCGVKILHGPSWSIEAQPAPEDRLDRPVSLSPVGAEEALSKVYGEQIKVIPDPGLLGQGIIPIVGRQTGIVILKNEGTRMGLPPWVDEETAARIKAAASIAGEGVSGKDVAGFQDQVKGLLARVAEYEERLSVIEKELDSIEYMPVTEEKKTQSEQPARKGRVEEIPEEIEETTEPVEQEKPILESLSEEKEEPAEEDDFGLDLDDLEALGDLSMEEEEMELPMQEIVEESLKDEGGEDLDLDFIHEIEKAVSQENEKEVKKVLSGETILILGGEEQYKDDYRKLVEELGGNCEWRQSLAELSESEIAEVVDRSDLILTLSDAITDPGILEATNYAQENNKRCFPHHSANPASVKKQLVKLVDEGKV